MAGKGVRKEVPSLLQRALYNITMLRSNACCGGTTAGEIQTIPLFTSAYISHATQNSKQVRVARSSAKTTKGDRKEPTAAFLAAYGWGTSSLHEWFDKPIAPMHSYFAILNHRHNQKVQNCYHASPTTSHTCLHRFSDSELRYMTLHAVFPHHAKPCYLHISPGRLPSSSNPGLDKSDGLVLMGSLLLFLTPQTKP